MRYGTLWLGMCPEWHGTAGSCELRPLWGPPVRRLFQSTPPVWEATKWLMLTSHTIQISIHASRVGGDRFPVYIPQPQSRATNHPVITLPASTNSSYHHTAITRYRHIRQVRLRLHIIHLLCILFILPIPANPCQSAWVAGLAVSIAVFHFLNR